MQTLKILLITFFLIINCFAQHKDTLSEPNPLKSHRWSVQFEVGNDFRLSSFDGVIVSLKYHFSPRFAIRFGAGLNISNSDQTLKFRDYYSGLTGRESYNDNSKDILITANVLFYPNPDGVLKIFFGAGPRATYRYVNDERIYLDGYKGHINIKDWSAGISGVMGCEWFPMNFISLFGEYSVYATFGKTESNEYVTENSTGYAVEYFFRNSENFIFRGNIARLGASFYF